MDRLDRRLQPSHFAQLTVWPGTSASFHAATRAELWVPGPGWLVMAGPGQFKRLKAAQLDEAPDPGPSRPDTGGADPWPSAHQRADRAGENRAYADAVRARR